MTAATVTRHVCPGLRPQPLASYLAGLGLVRVLGAASHSQLYQRLPLNDDGMVMRLSDQTFFEFAVLTLSGIVWSVVTALLVTPNRNAYSERNNGHLAARLDGLPGDQTTDDRIPGCSGEAGGDDGVMLAYAYEVTKYDPADRDDKGRYTGAQDQVSDHGPVEAAYLQAVADFAAETGVRQLAIREPQVAASVHFGLAPAIGGYGLAGLFPPDLAGYHDGAVVPVAVAVKLVRAMLRDNGAWCRLEAEDQLTVHVGWDQHLWIASTVPCQAALARAREAGLFPEWIDASPYAFTPDELDVQRPAGDEFWARLAWCVQTGQAAILEESPVHNMSRWHQLTAGTLEAVRARLAPRAMLTVWPEMPWRDVDAVLSTLCQDPRGVELVCKDAAGRIWSVIADGEWPPGDLVQVTAGAGQAAILETALDDRHPLMTAVLPDHDGVMRARWGNPAAPSDRHWALLRAQQSAPRP